MTCEILSETLASPALLDASERPVSIDGLFGWLRPGSNRRGVIFCGTYAYEQVCAHRVWRRLAHQVAETGCTTLRFDYPGEGDSAEAEGPRLAAWTTSVQRAIRYLREHVGVDEVVLVGLRLGATLAALTAEREAVDRLILLAPFMTGRAYLREMKFQARAINLLPDGTPRPAEPGVFNVGGFHLEPQFVSDLSAVDLGAIDGVGAPHVLIMGGDTTGLAAGYAANGCAVTSAPFPDLGGLVADPLTSTITRETASTVMAFAGSGALPGPPIAPAIPMNVEIANARWRETPVRFGADIFGIECRPANLGPPRAKVLFLNLGTIVRSGYGRQATVLARRLAASGIASLRMDLLGVGDSPDRGGGGLPLYNLDAIQDVRAAIDHLVGAGPEPVLVTGTCNGAYLAFHALCRDERIASAVLANLYCFDWNLTHGDETFSVKPIRSVAAYADLLKQREALRRVFTGQTPVASILAGVLRRPYQKVIKRIVGLFGANARQETIRERIARLRRRGAHLTLLYSAGDLGLADLRIHLGSSPSEVAAALGGPVHILEGADHSLGTTRAQDALFGLFEESVARIERGGDTPRRPASTI